MSSTATATAEGSTLTYRTDPADRRPAWNVMGKGLAVKGKYVEDVLTEKGLDYTIAMRSLLAVPTADEADTIQAASQVAEGHWLTVPQHRASVRIERDGSQRVLGVVGNRYTPVQNIDAFGWLDYLVGEFSAEIIGAADFRNGAKSLMVLDLHRPMEIGGRDRVESFLAVTTAHDGSGALQAAILPQRIACTNVLHGGLGKGTEQAWSFSHTPKWERRYEAAQRTILKSVTYLDAFQAEADRMLATAMTDREFDKIVAGLLPVAKDASERVQAAAQERRQVLRSLFHGPANAEIAGTRWAGYNAVTEFVDWGRPVRKGGDVARAEGALEGWTVRLKDKAFAAFSR